MLKDIEGNKCTLSYCIKEEEESGQDLNMFDIAMDMSHIHDKEDYTKIIQKKLPRLHDQITPSSLREMAFLEPMLQASKSDWKIDGLERALELERIEESMFFHQLKLHGMDHSFKKLLEELHLMWDEYGIPYNKRKRLLLVEIEMVSLLMCDVLPYNYSEQGIWVNDKSQGQYYNFFMNKDVDTGRKRWLDLLTKTTYDWFWKVYTNLISLATLNDMDIVLLDDIFDIITFIHPPAVQLLLNNDKMLRKYMFIKEKASKSKFWVESRHHLYYIWHFFGYRTLPAEYPSYDSTGMNDFHRATRWISNTISLDDFFNKYQHFYLTNHQDDEGQYLFYESPPTYDRNWQWEADPHNFQEETKLYNGIRAADLSELFSPSKIKQQNKRNIAKLTQSVLLRGHHNRIYHHSSSSKNYYHSTELPLDWLIYYDSLSRVSRDPTEIYGYNLFTVPYLILPDKTKRESHYHNSTEDFDTDWLISSKRKRITVHHPFHLHLTAPLALHQIIPQYPQMIIHIMKQMKIQ